MAMKEELRIQRIFPWSSQLGLVKRLYIDSFPAVERISWIWMLVMVALGQADFLAYFDQGKFAGFSYSLKGKDTYYLLFLAVPEEFHSCGYGSQILKSVGEVAENRSIFLVIEPMEEESENYELRLKRLAFYEKNGYHLTDYIYFENSEVYQVLTDKNPDLIWAFEKLAKRIQWSGMKIRVEKKK